MITRRGLLKAFGGFLAAGLATSAYAVGIEPMLRLKITTHRIKPANWPDGLTLRIVALADIQACRPWMNPSRIRSICETANGLGGDMVVLLGDYVSGMNMVRDYVPSAEWAEAMSGLSAPLGVHAILGNHDCWEDLTFQRDPAVKTIAQKALETVGIPVYVNRAVRIEKDGAAFWLAGLGDQLALRPGKRFGRKGWEGVHDVEGTLAQVSDAAPVILMAHEPDIFPDLDDRVAVTLSGHTHGGQIRLFGYSPVVPSRFGNRYAYGHVVEDGRHLCVSGGLGCSIAPVRFGSPPEIMIVELG